MIRKIYMFLTIALNFFAILGLYFLTYDLIRENLAIELPWLPLPMSFFIFPLLSMPVCSVVMLLKKTRWKKVIGFVYLLGTIFGLYLFDKALV